MKRKLSLLMACLTFLLLCACSQPAATTEAGESSSAENMVSQVPATNVTLYESNDVNIKLSYPQEWIIMSPEILNNPKKLNDMKYFLQITDDQAVQILSQMQFILYDLEMFTNTFKPNLNLGVTESTGIDPKQITSPAGLNNFRNFIESYMSIYLENFSFVTNPQNKTFGDNTYIVYQTKYDMSGLTLTNYQAITIYQEQEYTFTYTTELGKLTDEKIKQVEQVLSTVEFT